MNEVAELWWFTEGSVCHPGDGVLLLRCLVSSSLKGMVKALPCGHLLNCSLGIFFFQLYIILEYIWINDVVIVSGGQQRDLAIYIRVFILPQTPLPSRLPRNTEQSSLCGTVGLCWLSI